MLCKYIKRIKENFRYKRNVLSLRKENDIQNVRINGWKLPKNFQTY